MHPGRVGPRPSGDRVPHRPRDHGGPPEAVHGARREQPERILHDAADAREVIPHEEVERARDLRRRARGSPRARHRGAGERRERRHRPDLPRRVRRPRPRRGTANPSLIIPNLLLRLLLVGPPELRRGGRPDRLPARWVVRRESGLRRVALRAREVVPLRVERGGHGVQISAVDASMRGDGGVVGTRRRRVRPRRLGVSLRRHRGLRARDGRRAAPEPLGPGTLREVLAPSDSPSAPGAGRGRGRARGRHRRPSRDAPDREDRSIGATESRDAGRSSPASREAHPGPHRQRDGRQHKWVRAFTLARDLGQSKSRLGFGTRRLKRSVFCVVSVKTRLVRRASSHAVTTARPSHDASRSAHAHPIEHRREVVHLPRTRGGAGSGAEASSEDLAASSTSPGATATEGGAGAVVDRVGDDPASSPSSVPAIDSSSAHAVTSTASSSPSSPSSPSTPSTPSSVSLGLAAPLTSGSEPPSPRGSSDAPCTVLSLDVRRSRGRCPRDVRVQRRHRGRLARLRRGNPGAVLGPELRLGRRDFLLQRLDADLDAPSLVRQPGHHAVHGQEHVLFIPLRHQRLELLRGFTPSRLRCRRRGLVRRRRKGGGRRGGGGPRGDGEPREPRIAAPARVHSLPPASRALAALILPPAPCPAPRPCPPRALAPAAPRRRARWRRRQPSCCPPC